MTHDSFVCEIRCPVHGFIGLTDLERRLLDHPAFQRLRRIKQLAWTDYVYPGASHSRFEHSLGVMHIAGRLFESVVTSSESVLRDSFKYSDIGLQRDWQIVRLAGLLHDVGHAAFSHATEHLLPMKSPENLSLFAGDKKPERYKHEDYSVAIIENLLADVIDQHPVNRRNGKITADEVTALIAKRTSGTAGLFWKDIISGQLDADRMDYLLRDSLHAGVSYGHFDLNRIISSVCAVHRPTEETDEPKIALMRGGAFAAEALIVARYWMHKQVYFHKTRLACNHHLEEAMKDILIEEAGRPGETAYYPRPDTAAQLQEFLKWDDYRVMGLLAGGHGGEHGKRLMTRNHYRLICELPESGDTIDELANSVQRNKEIIAALDPLVKHVTNPAADWYKTKADDLVLVDDDSKAQVGYLSGYSALMKSINVGTLRFVYADKPDAIRAREMYRSLLRTLPTVVTEPESVDNPATSPEPSGPPIAGDQVTRSAALAQLTLSEMASPKSVKSESLTQKGVPNVG